jgi:TRAP-type C4-dicarboxylate transport system substrate-binding protein
MLRWRDQSGRVVMRKGPNAITNWANAIAGALALTVGAAFLNASPAASEVVTLRMHTFVPPVSSSYKSLRAWADNVEKASGGQLKIQLFGAMQLGGKAPDLYDQVKNGVVDIAWMLPGYKAGLFPATSVFELPFMAASVNGNAPIVSGAVDDYVRSMATKEWSAIHPIVMHYAGASVLHLKDKRVTKMEDFQGLKIRTPSRESTGALKAMGAVPVPVPGVATMAEIMIHGVVNGVITPWGIARAIKVIDASTFHAELPMHGPTLAMMMNKNSYAKLSPQQKKAIDDNSGAKVAEWLGARWVHDDEPGIKRAKELKHEIVDIPESEIARMRKVSQPVYDDWIKEMNGKGYDGAKLIAEAERLIAKHKASYKKAN